MTVLKAIQPLLKLFFRLYFCFIHGAFYFWSLVITRVHVTKPNEEDLNQLLLTSAKQAAEMIRNREFRSQQLIEVYIRRIQKVDNLLNAVVQENFDEALEIAKQIDDYLDGLDPSSDEYKELEHKKPLLGVPFTCKDAIRVQGLRSVCGIPALEDSPLNGEDADVIKLMREAGAIPLVVTNVPEAGLAWETSNNIYGRTRNPFDARLIAGGSSGGEGALISAAGSVIGIGSDFGGSIRIPSMFNGVFGFKPSPHLISYAGHIPDQLPPYHETMLSLGPICRYAQDLSLMLKIMVGPKNAKALKLDEQVNLRNVRFFYMNGLDNLVCSPLAQDCTQTLRKTVKYFEKKYDTAVYNVDFPIAHYAVDIFLTSMRSSGSLPMANVLSGFNKDKAVNVWLETIKALFGNSMHSAAALEVGIVDELPNFCQTDQDFVISKRGQLKREITELLGDDGVLIFPALPRSSYYHNEPLFCPFDFVYAGLWNALGLPVVSCPIGLNSSKRPLAIQLIGGVNADRILLAAACDLEEAFGGWSPLQH